jgi:O-antigen ligase
MMLLLDRWAISLLALGGFGMIFVMSPTTWLPTLIIVCAGMLIIINAKFRYRFLILFKQVRFRLIAWSFVSWFGVAVVIALVHSYGAKFHFPENEFRVFMAAAVLCFGAQLRARRAFYYGLVVGAAAATVWGICDMFVVQAGRAQGTMNNPIHFGNLTALGAVLSASACLLATDLRMRFRLVLLCSVILYSFASFTSVTRSSVILILCVLPLAWLPQKDAFRKWITITLGAVFIVATCSIIISESLQHRLRIHDFTAAFNNSQQIDYERLTSDRANMWHAATLMFYDHPWFGVGPVGFIENFQSLIEEGRVKNTYTHNQPHNDILYAASMGGVFKLLAYFALIFGPFVFFYKRYKANQLAVDKVTNVLGMQVVAAFFLTGLTNSNFDLQIYSTTYAVLVCVLAKLSSLDDSAAINAAEPSKLSTPSAPSC